MKPRSRRTGGQPNPGNAYTERVEATRGSAAGHYLSVPANLYYNPNDFPRAICPECGSRNTRNLWFGLFDPWPETTKPSWAWIVGCCNSGYDRFCPDCELLWSRDDRREPIHAYDPESPHRDLSKRVDHWWRRSVDDT